MKKTILSLAFASSALFASAQVAGISTVAAFDDFATTTQYGDTTTDMDFVNPTKHASKGIFWWTDAVTDPSGLDYTWTRGTGSLVVKIDQPYAMHTPIGLGFGKHAASANPADTSYSIDLSANASFEITLKANVDTANVDVLFQLKDADGTILYVDKGANALAPGKEPYQYQLGLAHNSLNSYPGGLDHLLPNGKAVTFSYDFANALPGSYPVFAADNSTFDYAHVVELAIFFTNSNSDANYNPYSLHNTFEISNFKLGDVSTITGVQDNFIASTNNGIVSVYDIMGRFVATGKLADLNLESGKLYVVKSGTTSRKIVMN